MTCMGADREGSLIHDLAVFCCRNWETETCLERGIPRWADV